MSETETKTPEERLADLERRVAKLEGRWFAKPAENWCAATTLAGHRCPNDAQPDSRYCKVHWRLKHGEARNQAPEST